MEEAIRWLSVLRATPHDPVALRGFLRCVEPRIRLLASACAGDGDPEEAAQRARVRIWRAAARCCATAPGQLHRWLDRIVRRCAADLAPRRHADPEAVDRLPDGADPEADLLHREQGRRVEDAVERALEIEPATLPPRHRAWARRHHVGASRERIGRDIAVALAFRRDERPIAEVAAEHRLRIDAARQAARRGVAAIQLGLRLMDDAGDGTDRIRIGIRIPAPDGGTPEWGPPILPPSSRDAPGSWSVRPASSEAIGMGGSVLRRSVPAPPGPLELLIGVAAGGRGSAEAFGQWLVAHPEGRRIPAGHREDVLHDVLAHFLARAPEIVTALVARAPDRGSASDPRVHAYVGRAIANRFESIRRKLRREVSVDLSRIPAAPDPEGPPLLERALAVLDRVELHVVAHAARPMEARRTLDELRDLALGERDMAAVVAAELAGDPQGDPIRARDRLYLRHRRMRRALVDAGARMAGDGRLDEDDLVLLEGVVRGLLRRRRVSDRLG